MKPIFILPALILLLLGAVFFFRDRGARHELAAAQTQLTALSNRVAEAKTQISTGEQSSQALQTNLAACRDQFTRASGKLEKTTTALKTAEATLNEIRGQMADRDTRQATLNTQMAQCERERESARIELSNHVRHLAQVREHLVDAEKEQDDLKAVIEKERAKQTQLLLQFNDPVALEQQQEKLRKDLAMVNAKENGSASGAPPRGGEVLTTHAPPPGGKGHFVLQPDGSVRLVRPQ